MEASNALIPQMAPGANRQKPQEGHEIAAYCYGRVQRVRIEREFPGSEWLQVRALEEPHRAPILIHIGDFYPDGTEALCNPPSP